MKSKSIYYNGNPLLKKAGVVQEYTKEELEEYIRCKNDIKYYCKNYVKIIDLDKGLVPFNTYDYQDNMIDTYHNNRFIINLLPRQMGKMLSLDTKLPTPDGWTTMGDCQEGDYVIGDDGKPTKIIFKSQENQIDTYEITFDNGEKIKACGEHQWFVNSNKWSEGKVLTTEELYNLENTKLYIPVAKPLKLPRKNLPINPYLLGVWLGDGTVKCGNITGNLDDLKEIINNIDMEVTNKYRDNRGNGEVWTFTLKQLSKQLGENGLINGKHIPEIYLRASFTQRLELLKGLMDTDGHCDKKGRCEFYQKDGILLDQVKELISTLGIKFKSRYRIIDGLRYYTLSFNTHHKVFKLKRKLQRQKSAKLTYKRNRHYIISIKIIPTEPMQCIEVDNDSHLYLCGETMIPTHNTTTVAAYLSHYSIFNMSKSLGILANKLDTSVEILDRLKTVIENLPFFLQPGVKIWNKKTVEFGNESSIIAAATSSASIRGKSLNVIYLDEFAHVENADDFYTSTYPVISSGEDTKVIITSTPNGMNLFYKLYEDARMGRSDFVPIRVRWQENPKYTLEWKETTLRNMANKKKFNQEYECEFHGSSGTLISGEKLAELTWQEPDVSTEKTSVYKASQLGHIYIMTVDTGEGTGNDFTVLNVTDVTQEPYEQVLVWRDNETDPLILPEYIFRIATEYNEALVLIETQSVGTQTANILWGTYEYENIMFTQRKDEDVFVSSGFGANVQIGLRMNKKTKRIGCSNLKALIENNVYIINDFNTINELQTFVLTTGGTYEAEKNKNDDIVMSLVIFGWLASQSYFSDLTDINNRQTILERQREKIEADMLPLGYSTDYTEDTDYYTNGITITIDENDYSLIQ